MKLLQIVVVLMALAISAQALSCWVCENAKSNADCLRKGRTQRCQSNQRACHNEVRRGSYGMLITKRCKQALACDNNFIQNPRAAWFPSQCNTRVPSSVCRCCCNSDLCNRDSVECSQEPKIIEDLPAVFVCNSSDTAKNCPPYAVMDLALVLDSSSSINITNWKVMKAGIRDFIESFEISAQFSRLSVIRFNAKVDTANRILFDSYNDDNEELLAAYDRIPYDGNGTKTGQALQYARDVLFKEVNGDRRDAPNILIVFTDGVAQDQLMLKSASEKLRADGVILLAVGIGNYDPEELRDIVGTKSVFEAEDGFEKVKELLEEQITNEVCMNACMHKQSL